MRVSTSRTKGRKITFLYRCHYPCTKLDRNLAECSTIGWWILNLLGELCCHRHASLRPTQCWMYRYFRHTTFQWSTVMQSAVNFGILKSKNRRKTMKIEFDDTEAMTNAWETTVSIRAHTLCRYNCYIVDVENDCRWISVSICLHISDDIDDHMTTCRTIVEQRLHYQSTIGRELERKQKKIILKKCVNERRSCIERKFITLSKKIFMDEMAYLNYGMQSPNLFFFCLLQHVLTVSGTRSHLF